MTTTHARRAYSKYSQWLRENQSLYLQCEEIVIRGVQPLPGITIAHAQDVYARAKKLVFVYEAIASAKEELEKYGVHLIAN